MAVNISLDQKNRRGMKGRDKDIRKERIYEK